MRETKVAQLGLDSHRTFSNVTAREAAGKIVWRKRVEHGDRRRLREELRTWPRGAPVVLNPYSESCDSLCLWHRLGSISVA